VEITTYDLAVIGGGPAGTSAAITAANAGARVLLLERRRFPRHKVCGEFVSAESLGLLKNLLGIQHTALLRDAIRIPHARVFIDGRMLESAVEPAAASVARLDLDAAMWDSALRAGVDARQQTTVHAIKGPNAMEDGRSGPSRHESGGSRSVPIPLPFRIATSSGEFRSRALINASGRWSNLTVTPSANERPPEKWLGLKGHFTESSPPASVDLYFFDGGYCGVQPVDLSGRDAKGGRVNACAMVRADVASTLPEVFLQHPALQARSLEWQPLSEPVTTSPLIFRAPQPEREGILLAGDAAGFVDPFVGDGISLALRGGALAARSLRPFLEGKASWQDAVSEYREDYEKQLAPVFRASSKLRRMLVLPRSVRKPLLFILEKTPAVKRYVISKTR
jgi:flavin-dependent dehydrogenase